MKKTEIARNRIITFTTTLLVKRIGLILGLALLIFACEDPGEIGLELNPENGLFVAKYQDVPLDNSVILYEKIVSDNATRIDSFNNINSGGRLLVGSFENQQFGKLNSKVIKDFPLILGNKIPLYGNVLHTLFHF